VLHGAAYTGSRELFRLAVLTLALGVAFGAASLFGVSIALGAFFAGMVLSESKLSQRAAEESLPLRDAFAVLFFVSVGMLFDPAILLRQPIAVLAVLLIIVVGKACVSFGLLMLLRRSLPASLTLAAGFAQIGEFSFILADLGVGLKILPQAARDLILAGSILSIIVNPLMFYLAGRLEEPLSGKQKPAPVSIVGERRANAEPPVVAPKPEPTRLTGHTILIGYGRVGSLIAEGLAARAMPFLVIEDAQATLKAIKAKGFEAVDGNAATPGIMALANIKQANTLVIAAYDAFEAGRMAEQARKMNPSIRIVARAHSDAEADHLSDMGADIVVEGSRQIAQDMLLSLTPPEKEPQQVG
jgi:CPA2 family monovalent cation:H+ antiporter-2